MPQPGPGAEQREAGRVRADPAGRSHAAERGRVGHLREPRLVDVGAGDGVSATSRPPMVLLRMSMPRTSLLRMSSPDRVHADVLGAHGVVRDLPAVDEAGGDAVGDASERDEQRQAGDQSAGDGRRQSSRGFGLLSVLGSGFRSRNTPRWVIGAVRRGQRHGEDRAPALGASPHVHGTAVGIRHGAHDRQPQPAAATAVSPPSRVKRSNTRPRISAGTPGPRSATSSTTSSPVAAQPRPPPGCRAGCGGRRSPRG